jgi:hypothetical protein
MLVVQKFEVGAWMWRSGRNAKHRWCAFVDKHWARELAKLPLSKLHGCDHFSFFMLQYI